MVKTVDKQVETEQQTRERLIQVATRMFAQHGFDGVSVRQITAAANANVGAVNYHFGSKEALIGAVFQARAKPINTMRLSLLDEFEREAGTRPLPIEKIVTALIRPAILYASDVSGGGLDHIRLLVLARALPRPYISKALADQYDVIFQRFVNALMRSLPELRYEEIAWRYDFAIGTLLYSTNYFDGTSRIKRVTNGLCDPADIERIICELVAFTVGGITGKRLEHVALPAPHAAIPTPARQAPAGRRKIKT